MSDVPLNPRQLQFVEEYLIDLHGTNAARRAGYAVAGSHVQASRLLSDPKIQAAIANRRQEILASKEVTAEKVLGELAKMGFANMQDYMRVDANGTPRLDFSALTREQAAALQEVTVDEYMAPNPGFTGKEDEQRLIPARKVKFKLADKRAALVDLGRYLGIFQDKKDANVNITIENLVMASMRTE